MALIPQDWGPYKKRRWGSRHTQRDACVRTQRGKRATYTLRREASGGAGPAHPWISASSQQDEEEEMSVV